MIFPRLAATVSRTAPRRATPSAVVATTFARRPLSVSSARFSEPTHSEQAAKADLHHKDATHEELQKHTTEQHKKERRADKVTASPNDRPTESEDAAHADKNHGHEDIESLQKKTAQKASGKH